MLYGCGTFDTNDVSHLIGFFGMYTLILSCTEALIGSTLLAAFVAGHLASCALGRAYPMLRHALCHAQLRHETRTCNATIFYVGETQILVVPRRSSEQRSDPTSRPTSYILKGIALGGRVYDPAL